MPSATTQPVNLELERAELELVLASRIFVRSPTLAHLLSYLCEKTFSGETAQIKEYSIALDVFGRHETFDQDTDSIVRVQVNRLRKRLAEYYAGEGAAHELRISIPVGHYVPLFQNIPAAPTSLATEIAALPIQFTQEISRTRLRSRTWLMFAGAIVLAILAVVGLGLRKREMPKPTVVPPKTRRAGAPGRARRSARW